jgi:hypothetical protein
MRLLGLSIVSLALGSSIAHAQNAERRGIGLVPSQTRAMGVLPAGAGSANIDPRRSLFITDQVILEKFTFAAVMDAIAKGAPGGGLTKEKLFAAWWDTANKSSPTVQIAFPCDRPDPALNGFPYECPRREGTQSATDPFAGAAEGRYIPIALSNRFDLATLPSEGGQDCGEYRIVFARVSGQTNRTNRNLIIFEAVLPNPKPNGKDLEGCRPVAEFWANLTNNPDRQNRANKLRDFYFVGEPGFGPVIAAKNYGSATATARGQVRTNQFMQFNWILRQFHVVTDAGSLRFKPVAVGNNPAGTLFDAAAKEPLGVDFRKAFVGVVKTLAIDDIDTFNMGGLDKKFDAAESDEMDARENDYVAQSANSAAFLADIGRSIPAGPLTPTHIVRRATALSCAGCHQLSNDPTNSDLGGSLAWKPSLGFVHTSEADGMKDCPGEVDQEPKCFPISKALELVFLPNRQDILGTFVGNAPKSK